MGALSIALIAIVAFFTTVLAGYFLIPTLKRLKFGQTILEIGPRWHKDKQGTPTMGGIFLVMGVLLATMVGMLLYNLKLGQGISGFDRQNRAVLLIGMVMAVAFGLVGFLDDFIKIAKKENLGLTEKQKLLFQVFISAVYIFLLYVAGEKSTIVWIPFIGQWEMGFLYYPTMVLGIIFLINVVNFTDGIDGLCSAVTFVVGVGFLFISSILKYLAMEVLSAALIGGCLGFIVWNAHPAKVFMGDTGSFFLGGIVVALMFGLRMPVVIIFMGFVYIVEGFSVIIQMSYFKYTKRKYGQGKRIFKMTPIHHHFEMSGWTENKIVLVFSLMQGIMSVVAIFAVTRM